MPHYFDDALLRVNADKIKPMVKIWGGSYKMSKYDCVDFIAAALKDPARVKTVIASLEPWERNALAIVKRMGGIIQNSTLKIGIFASGLHPQRTNGYREDFIEKLFRRGLILAMNAYSPEYITESYGGGTLYSDERILAQVGFPEYQQFEIQSMSASGETFYRRRSTVSLDIIGLLHAIENLGGLMLTQNGTVRVNDETKLRKALQWDEKGIERDGFYFPNPVQAWLSAFSCSDLLKKADGNRLVLQESPEYFVQRPLGEQTRLLVEGLIRTQTWWELPTKDNLDNEGKRRRQGRLALTMALSALPLNPDAFFSFDDFEQTLFKRIGQDFSLGYTPSQPYFFKKTTQEQQRELTDWQEKIRSSWLNQEYPWLKRAFTTWLYFLGLVELTMENGQPVGFRLTEIGRATFHPELTTASSIESDIQASTQPAWVVQPNFDIITYLDRVSPSQLAFLERHTERTKSHLHTAHYRLTRESVYRGLENGSKLDDLLNRLQTGSQTELPQNVIVELREWASLRECITLHRNARLIEFSSVQALQAELAQGLIGSVFAERFLLLKANFLPHVSSFTSINYALPLPKNLTMTESGIVHLKHNSHDLMTSAQLSQWALRSTDAEWQLSAESISTALQLGHKINGLQVLLKSGLAHPIPPLLEIALRSWAGEAFDVELESVIILRCPQEQVFQAVVTSPLMKPLLKGFLFPDLLFVDSEHIEILYQHLNWLGWKVSDQLKIIPSGSLKPDLKH